MLHTPTVGASTFNRRLRQARTASPNGLDRNISRACLCSTAIAAREMTKWVTNNRLPCPRHVRISSHNDRIAAEGKAPHQKHGEPDQEGLEAQLRSAINRDGLNGAMENRYHSPQVQSSSVEPRLMEELRVARCFTR